MSSSLSREFLTLHKIIQAAGLNLNRNIWDYLIGGTEIETTLRRNRQALDSVAFRPRVLVAVVRHAMQHGREIAETHVCHGNRRSQVLIIRERWRVNAKHIHRLYQLKSLQMWLKPPPCPAMGRLRLDRSDTTGSNQI